MIRKWKILTVVFLLSQLAQGSLAGGQNREIMIGFIAARVGLNMLHQLTHFLPGFQGQLNLPRDVRPEHLLARLDDETLEAIGEQVVLLTPPAIATPDRDTDIREEEQQHANLILGDDVFEGPRLFLGNMDAAINPARHGIAAVLNCAPCQVERDGSIEYYMECDLADAPSLNAARGVEFDDAARYFLRSGVFLNNLLEQGCSVLAHCVGGISRSATIVISYLIQYRGLSLREAYARVLGARPIIGPNAGFFNQLVDLEYKVCGKNSMKRALSPHQRVFKVAE